MTSLYIPSIALDVRQSAASTAIPSSPAVLVLPTIAQSRRIDYNTSNGEMTLLESAAYQFVFMFNVQAPALGGTLFYGADIDTGSGYASSQYSGREANLPALSTNQVLFASANYFDAGTKIRFYVWCSVAGANFVTAGLTALPTGSLSVPGARILISGD